VSRFAASFRYTHTYRHAASFFLGSVCCFAGPRHPFCILACVAFGFARKTDLSEDKTQSTKIRYALPRSTLFSQESSPPTFPLALFSLRSSRDARICRVTRKHARGTERFPLDPMHFYGIRDSNLLEHESSPVQRARCRRSSALEVIYAASTLTPLPPVMYSRYETEKKASENIKTRINCRP